jgi:hypothetical protein
VHRADDQVVVPAAEVVVDVDCKQQAAGVDEPGSFGRGLPAVQGVAEVQQDADVVHAHVLYRQQGLGGDEKNIETRGSRGLYSMANAELPRPQLLEALRAVFFRQLSVGAPGRLLARLTGPQSRR